jgi:eukaryotic-like serine/threonine-protein kinase
MTLPAGSRLGPYEILSAVGAGGMGEVYKAKDTRLERTVAVKVLPSHLSENAEFRQRFEREAKTISQLSHPHICTLHDVGNQDGVEYLVMEFLEGETLAVRLAKRPLPLEQVLRYGIQISDALDKAHRQGIVHRDLKPGNVMLTKSGLKLVDFGLARLAGPALGSIVSSLSVVPTQAEMGLTTRGAILGTFQYMAPEQLEGREADARTDIWALGLVLYEMSSGKEAFSGRSQASLIGAILKEEPPPLTQRQPTTPPALERAVRTCLAKDPDDRWQSAHDVAAELQWIAEAPGGVAARGPRSKSDGLLLWALGAAVGLLTLTLTLVLTARRPAEQPLVVRAAIPVPEGTGVDSISLSPDGRLMAFAGSSSEGPTRLWVRPLDSDTARELPGTEGAKYPFWSPDGHRLGFFAEGALKKVDLMGGAAETLCPASQPRGGSWNRDGVIVFAPNTGSGLYRISASGGTPTALTTLDAKRREGSHRWPYFLPDDRHLLYYARSGQQENSAIYAVSLDSREVRRLMAASSNAAYAPPGYLLFERGGKLVAQQFDARTLSLGGEPVAVTEDVAYDGGPFRSLFTVSQNGVLAYQTAAGYTTRIASLDRSGRRLAVLASSENSYNLALSPDDKRLAVSRFASQRGSRDIWLYDLLRGTSSRLTFGSGAEVNPLWSPDGSRIVFGSDLEGVYDLYQKPATGSAREELLLSTSQPKYADDWSPDGRHIVFESLDPDNSSDLWVLGMTGEQKPAPFLRTNADEREARFSPDGRWLAYASDESGRPEVYVQSFPASGGSGRCRAAAAAFLAGGATGRNSITSAWTRT